MQLTAGHDTAETENPWLSSCKAQCGGLTGVCTGLQLVIVNIHTVNHVGSHQLDGHLIAGIDPQHTRRISKLAGFDAKMPLNRFSLGQRQWHRQDEQCQEESKSNFRKSSAWFQGSHRGLSIRILSGSGHVGGTKTCIIRVNRCADIGQGFTFLQHAHGILSDIDTDAAAQGMRIEYDIFSLS